MNWKSEHIKLATIVAVFAVCFWLPVGVERFNQALMESLHLVRWYAREHVILCLVPAFFIAGAIGVFVSQAAVMKYLGAQAKKIVAYSVASVSGVILAVCSCTVLPLFSGIYRMGAGLGPATTFLYSGPAINVLAIVLTARILGIELGVARAVGAIIFGIIIGLLMHLIFRKEEKQKTDQQMVMPEAEVSRPLWQNVLYFASMVGILLFANWGKPEDATGIWAAIYSAKWVLTGGFAVAFAVILVVWFQQKWWTVLAGAIPVVIAAILFPEEPMIPFVVGAIALSLILFSSATEESKDWLDQTWGFAKQILPLLLIGVLVAGLLLGRPGNEGLIPAEWVHAAVGGNSLQANFIASFIGAFMYFATLTEVPIIQGLIDNGMGNGPALALLLAGPALSLPNMLVIRSVLGNKKTAVFIVLVVIMATICGMIFGAFYS